MPKYLFNAAMAREMMGHELQAFVHLNAFLAVPGLPEAEVIKAQDRIRALKERTIKLRVRVSPADLPAGTLALDARRRGGPEVSANWSEVRLEPATLAALAVPGAPGAYDLPLELGLWDLEFAGRGYKLGRTSVQAAPGPAYPVVVQLERLSDTVDVTTEFMPPAALAAGVEVVLQGPAPTTRQRVERSPVTLRLKPGAWTLEANAPGYETVRKDFTAGPEPVRLQVQLAPRRRDGRRLALGLGVAGGVIVVTGAAVLGVAGGNWGGDRGHREKLLDETAAYAKTPSTGSDPRWKDASDALDLNWYGANGGAGIMGAGLGLGLGALAIFAQSRRRVVIVQLTTGALAILGGGVAYAFVLKAQDKQRFALVGATRVPQAAGGAFEEMGARKSLKRRYAEGIASSLLIGVGAGLVVSGIIEAVFERKKRVRAPRASLRPYYTISGGGLTLQTNF